MLLAIFLYEQFIHFALIILRRKTEIIMITCPCNEDPFTPHFYIVKIGFTGVYIIYLFLL